MLTRKRAWSESVGGVAGTVPQQVFNVPEIVADDVQAIISTWNGVSLSIGGSRPPA
jgi:hypothetical protein